MTSAGITTIEVDVSTFFGLPQTISFMGLKIDVDRDLYSVHSRDGDKEKDKDLLFDWWGCGLLFRGRGFPPTFRW